LRSVLRFRIETVAVAETSPVNEKGNQNDDKRNRPSGGADGNSLRRVGVAASIGAIPNLADSDENENERPVGRKNRPRIERRSPVMQEKESSYGNENDRENERDSPGIAVLGHGTPPLLVLRARMKNSSARAPRALPGKTRRQDTGKWQVCGLTRRSLFTKSDSPRN